MPRLSPHYSTTVPLKAFRESYSKHRKSFVLNGTDTRWCYIGLYLGYFKAVPKMFSIHVTISRFSTYLFRIKELKNKSFVQFSQISDTKFNTENE